MKDELALIEQGYLIEALSPRAYSDLAYWARHGLNDLQSWTIEDILCTLPLPYYDSESKFKVFKRLVQSVAAKERFERRIERVRRQAYLAKTNC